VKSPYLALEQEVATALGVHPMEHRRLAGILPFGKASRWKENPSKRSVFVLCFLVLSGLLRLASDLSAAPALQTNDAPSTGILSAQIDPLLAKENLSVGHIGIIFRDGVTGRVLYGRNADFPLKPASNSKILTTAAAFHYLGRDYRYKTLVAMRGSQTSDTLQGDLVVVGSGDPSISGRFVKDHDRKAIFHQWAEEIRRRGIRRITGDIVGIDDAFDDQPQAPGWPTEDRGEWYCAEISALAYNEGCIDLCWRGTNGEDKEPATFEMLPPTRYVQVINFVTTVRERGPHERFYERADKRNVITAHGRVGQGETVFDSATVTNPTLYFITVLAETLSESGIEIGGRPRDGDEYADKTIFHRSLDPIAFYESPPLSQLIEVVNRSSQNFFAEQIFKTLGKHAMGEGSFGAGASAVRRYMDAMGIDCRGLRLVDGSGLSHLDRVTPAQLAAVLLAVDRMPDGLLFRETLPQGGQTGSLRKRFQDTARLRQVGLRVRAKTGFIRGCHGLSGWVETRAKQPICFSILCNDLAMTDEQAKLLIERVVAQVAELQHKK